MQIPRSFKPSPLAFVAFGFVLGCVTAGFWTAAACLALRGCG